MQIWSRVLCGAYGWTADAVRDWGRGLVGTSVPELVFHLSPMAWLVPLLVPDRLKRRLSKELLGGIHKEIFSVLSREDELWIPESDAELSDLRRAVDGICKVYERRSAAPG